MKFELSPYNQGVTDEELLADLRAVAAKLSTRSLTQSKYNEHGKYSAATIKKRLGKWNAVLVKAGLTPSKLMDIGLEELIADMQRWQVQSAVRRIAYESVQLDLCFELV